MRKYSGKAQMKLEKVICNKCGRELKVENGILKEGCFQANTLFGYFSTKDGKRHLFDMCEKCYNTMISEFQIPIVEIEENELC